MADSYISDDLSHTIEEVEQEDRELSYLFGEETVKLARQIDVVDLNMNEEIINSIGAGIGQLKKLKHDPEAQLRLVKEMEEGTRLLLCMWIMDMSLLEKIRSCPYIPAAK